MRFSALLPLACAIASFVLSMLCLFAGSKPGFMEDYHIVTLNTSTLGHVLVPTRTTTSSPSPTSIGSFFSGLAHNITSTIENELGKIEGDVADKLASKLGISQWYSWHLLDFCEGTYSPNATARGARLNTTECSNKTAMYHFNIDKTLNSELKAGPLHLNLSFIDWPSEIEDGISAVSGTIDALFVFYALGIAAAGCAIISSLIAFFMHGNRPTSFANWGLAALSFLCLLIASIMITIAQKQIAHVINKYGNEIGVFAYKGGGYLGLSWGSVGAMFLAMCWWVGEFCVGRRNKGREYTEKKGSHGRKWWGRNGSDEAAVRRSGV